LKRIAIILALALALFSAGALAPTPEPAVRDAVAWGSSVEAVAWGSVIQLVAPQDAAAAPTPNIDMSVDPGGGGGAFNCDYAHWGWWAYIHMADGSYRWWKCVIMTQQGFPPGTIANYGWGWMNGGPSSLPFWSWCP